MGTQKVLDKREAILDAAMGLVAEQGFHAAPVALIAQRAGVAAGTLYHYFQGKEEMLAALYARSKQRMGAALLAGADMPGSYKARFFHHWGNLLRFYLDNPEEFAFQEQYASSPRISPEVRAENEQHYQPVVDFLAQGVSLGILRDMDLRLLVGLVYGSVVSTAKLHHGGELRIEGKHFQDAAQCAWDSVKLT